MKKMGKTTNNNLRIEVIRLMLVVLSIFFILILLVSVLLFSNIKIEIQNFSKSNYDAITKELGKKDFYVKIGIYFMNRIPLLAIKLNSKRMHKIYSKQKLEQIDEEKIKEIIPNKEVGLQAIKDLEIELLEFKLGLAIGTEDVLLTSGIVCILASLLGILLPKIMREDKLKDISYHIQPIYKNKNLYKIDLDCIINVKVVHIICMIDNILKRRRVDKNDRASHRRAYDYSYE